MRITSILSLVLLLTSLTIYGQQKHQERFEGIDIKQYVFDIVLNDDSDQIVVNATVDIAFKKPSSTIVLDLVKKNDAGKGMTVTSVEENGIPVNYDHVGDVLAIKVSGAQTSEIRSYEIKYEGVPLDGLVISENKYGQRTFFGDNWPDRAKNWLPVVDHPSDKSMVEWIITAPSHYQSIGNGVKIEETNISDSQTLTRWKTIDPIPTKVMVIGVARFAVQDQGEISGIPVSSWVYPQDRDNGFYDYGYASPIMDYFINHIGPYPFRKLANVQSKTRFGGMENAGNIFYSESSVTGTGASEELIAHEIAHQWFGNSASELNWHHAWLSEGFATYFTNLYVEHQYGRDKFVKAERKERQEVIDFSKKALLPIVNTKVDNYMKLLNPNSYQKGGWVLHMLRRELGDKVFWEGIRHYYNEFKLSNALTEDLQRVMEQVSGKDLNSFFKQWIYQPGQPELDITWSQKSKKVIIDIEQKQKKYVFNFPIDIKVVYEDGSDHIKTINVSEQSQEVKLAALKKVKAIEADPNVWLLFELLSIKQK